MARFSLIPREERFFDEFVALAEQIRTGARTLKQMLAGGAPDMARAEEIKEIEHSCDRATRAIIARLNRTFVTPLDREDIHALASELDDIMDAIDAAAAVIRLYQIAAVRSGARRLTDIIVESMDRVTQALVALEKKNGVLELAAQIKQLEHEADRCHQDAIVELFEQERADPILVMKWKEIFDLLEGATDRCEDVANLIEGVVVKNG